MRTAERDGMLFVLAISAGSADGWSYFGLGHAFVANMTGNTVLLGMAVFQKDGDLLHPLISLACYAFGVGLASFLTRKVRPGVVWSRAISWTLLLEGLLMAVADAGWLALHPFHRPPDGPTALTLNLLLGCVAVAIGIQSGVMLQLKVPGIVTTYITGTWTTLINGLARFTTEPKRRRGQEIEFEKRLRMQAGILVVYFLSAVLTGWFFRYLPRAVGAVTAGSVLFVAVYGVIRSRNSSRSA